MTTLSFDAFLSTGAFLATSSAERDAFIRLARTVLGRTPKTKAEIDAVIAPFVEAGLVRIHRAEVAPKGCPGGRPRPATITRTSYELTKAGEAANLEWKKAHPERLTPWQRKVLGV